LLKEGKNPHKLKIPFDLVETNLVEVFGPTMGRKGRTGYMYSECNDVEVLAIIVQIFSVVYLRDLSKSKVITKQFTRGIVMEKHKKKLVVSAFLPTLGKIAGTTRLLVSTVNFDLGV